MRATDRRVNSIVISQVFAITAPGQQPVGGRPAETDGPLDGGQPLSGGLIGTLLPGVRRVTPGVSGGQA